MKRRFRIGEMARLFQISASTLRYYDQIGLFRPGYVDSETQYRYYNFEQFVVLDTIIFLKKNGFSIDDIHHQLANRTAENTKELLESKQREIENEMARLKKVSAMIQSKIETINEGLTLRQSPSFVYRYFPERPITYLYNDQPVDLFVASDAIFLKDLEELASAGGGYDGFFTGDMGTMVDMDSLHGEGPAKYFAVFIFISKDKETAASPSLPEGTYACYPHRGPYETIKESYAVMLDHLKEDGRQISGTPLEVSVLDESVTNDSSAYVTWIQIPVTKND
ncbi:MerR family transcriptional regulator [Halobacillus sp. Cin3]|uniref:MerR family transcriptional regulator n=1 Tax=Halobacillus sp. Cin3 TaxID=2928441 RepID=UPI00248F2162|nr:MerR family transcriptional regulator [Halobacillus sp. Cin3]